MAAVDHQNNCLNEWKFESVASDLPCLIFDAWTGDRLNLDSANPSIREPKRLFYLPLKVSV